MKLFHMINQKKDFSDRSKGLKEGIKVKGISFRVNLILCFFIPVLCIIVLGLVSYRFASEKIIKNYEASTVATINTTAKYYGLILKNIEDSSLQILNDTSMKQYYNRYYKGNKSEENEILQNLRSNIVAMATANTIIENIVIITDYGKEIVSYGSFIQNQTKTPYEAYLETEEGKQVAASGNACIWSGYHNFFDKELGINTNQYGITLNRQYFNSASNASGVIVVDVNKSILEDVIHKLDLPQGSSFALISPDGREITGLHQEQAPIFTDKEFFKRTAASDEKDGYQYVDIKGINYLYVYTKVGQTDVMVCATIPTSYLIEQANIIKLVTLVIAGIAALIAILTGILFSGRICTSIQDIIQKLILAGKGDLTVVIETKRKDEFGILVDSVNHMISNMKKLLEKATEINKYVLSSSNQVAANSENMLCSVKDISTAIHDIQQGVVSQAEDAEECLMETNDLSKRISKVNENASEMEVITSSTKDMIQNGIKIVQDLNEKIKSTVCSSESAIHNMDELEVQIQSINTIIKVITEIAEQTNLLSLNANIEAARAGALGRGFAVVADEIRRLAEQSNEAANKISSIIYQIQNKTTDTVVSVKETSNIIKSQEYSLQNTVQVFYDINKHVEGLIDKADSINEEIKDIEIVKIHTLNAISSISAISEETAAAAQEMDATAEEQLHSADSLNQVAAVLKENVTQLTDAIKIFKV